MRVVRRYRISLPFRYQRRRCILSHQSHVCRLASDPHKWHRKKNATYVEPITIVAYARYFRDFRHACNADDTLESQIRLIIGRDI